MIKAVAAFNKAAGHDRMVLVSNDYQGPRGTHEEFKITVDGTPHRFSAVCRVTIKDFVTTMGYLFK